MPPGPMGEWSAFRHLFHLHYYEKSLALPGTEQWWGGAIPKVADGDEESAWQVSLEAGEDLAAQHERATWEDRTAEAPLPTIPPTAVQIPGDLRLFEDLLSQFLALRQAQASLLLKAPDEAWDQPLATVWGQTTLAWVVSKTYQHTAEHISDVLSIALFWDRFNG